MQTPYGYSGSNALGSGAKVGMALAGGMVAGAMGGYMLSQLARNLQMPQLTNPWSLSCTHGSWLGNCGECSRMYPQSSCYAQIDVSALVARDDLMDTSFMPAQYTFPITVTITGIKGVDFDASRICPPPGWNSNVTTWAPPANTSLFLSLTKVERILQPEPSGVGPAVLVAVAAVLACCCCGCIALAGCAVMMRQGKRGRRQDDSSDEGDSTMSGSTFEPEQSHAHLQNHYGTEMFPPQAACLHAGAGTYQPVVGVPAGWPPASSPPPARPYQGVYAPVQGYLVGSQPAPPRW